MEERRRRAEKEDPQPDFLLLPHKKRRREEKKKVTLRVTGHVAKNEEKAKELTADQFCPLIKGDYSQIWPINAKRQRDVSA